MSKEKNNITEFGPETEFDGVLNFTDNLIISGKFKGSINATGNLEIEKTASCNVSSMSANSIVISGHVNGDIEAPERVELCKGCVVKGNIKTSHLRIAEDVEFDGQVSMIDNPPDVDIFSVASKEFKESLITKSNEVR